MKKLTIHGFSGLAFLSLLAFLPALVRAGVTAEARTLTASAVSVKIEGTSTLHGWQASAGSVTVTALVQPGGTGLLDEVSQGGLQKLDLVLGVDSLKSTESSSMDKNLHHDLESDKFPTINFSLNSYHLEGLTVTAQGVLGIHGQNKSVTLVGLVATKDGGLVVSGVYPLLMSDYGVKPPVMMFGTVKVADAVKIVYSFKLPD
jgi:hypothetical protein